MKHQNGLGKNWNGGVDYKDTNAKWMNGTFSALSLT